MSVDEIEKSMDAAIKQLDAFQEKLSKEKPENYLRDINIIEGLKRVVIDTFKGLKQNES